MRIGVIMAGGAGERFWPYSRRHHPKQFLCFSGDKSLLTETVERISPLIPPERVFIVAGSHLKDAITKVVPALPKENILIEPMPRNTAPCLALAVAVTSRLFQDPTMAVLTADHYIDKTDAFLNNIDTALRFAEENTALVTIGIPAERPDTGFGYIEAGDVVARTERGIIRTVRKFHEKPDKKTAEEYLKQGNFFWNSGMFFWRNSTFYEAVRQKAPELADAVEKIKSAWGTPQQQEVLHSVFESLPATSIDYALMEKADNVFMVEAQFVWDDVGTWHSLERILEQQPDGNVVVGNCLLQDTSNTIIFNKPVHYHPDREFIIATIGIRDLVIVNTGDGLLICPKDRCQEVRKIVESLREKGLEQYL
ncbi:mannose-1-phosphate guanylyltransferase [Candidatus Sumerlaeota bacterium]|nr:mannose-1-phosphate guanylyltransferase [Candidatus Sumerlaeota bacterium]